MKLLHTNVSPLISSQFPAFYNEDGALFVEFVKEYYKWLEASGNPLYHSRHLLEYGDIDSTLDTFLPHFQLKYLAGTPTNIVGKQRDLIKHARDIYQTKGTIESLRLIFQLLFGVEINVVYPGDSILRTSDGVWITPRYLELSVSDRTQTYIGKSITGSISGAKGYVESIDRRTYNGRVVDVVTISNLQLNVDTGLGFLYGELVSDDGVVEGAPKIVGSLSRIGITSAGAGFEEGQVIDVKSTRNGVEGKARVTSIGNRTGEVNYLLVNGGYGYSNTADIIISANVLSIAAYRTSNTLNTHFPQFSTVVQPLANVTFSTANTTFNVGQLVYGVNTNSAIVAAGFVMSANQATTTGSLLISPHNIANVSLTSVITPANTGSFQLGEVVYQTNSSGNAAVGVIVSANSSRATIDQYIGPFSTATVYGATSGARATISAATIYPLTNTHFSNSTIHDIVSADSLLAGAYRTGTTDMTATALVVGANTGAVGVTNVVNHFISGTNAWIYNANVYATAEVLVTSSGNPGGFKIGSITGSETVYLNTDVIGSNNSSNTPYLSLAINASQYGLPANTAVGYTSVIGTGLTRNPFNIGTIATLTQRYPGYDNTAKPFVVEIEKGVAAYNKRSLVDFGLTSMIGQYRTGEPVTMSTSLPVARLTVSSVNGTFSYSHREIVKQQRADGNTVYGELFMSNITGANGQLQLYIANTSMTFDNTAPVVGTLGNAHATVVSVQLGNTTSTARGTVVDVKPNTVKIHRESFQDFQLNGTLYGGETGATAVVSVIQEDYSSPTMGDDAFVDPLAGIADGTIAAVEIIDSGVFYENGETVELNFANNQTAAYGVAYVESYGVAEGFWRGSKGTLDSTIRIQDNDYYQEYSYVVQSGVDRAEYESAVKSLTHVAGTKMFSEYVDASINHQAIGAATLSSYDRITTLGFSNVVGTFVVGQIVHQGSASGTILSFNSTLNTMDVVDVVGSFAANSTAVTSTAGQTGLISDTKITLQ